MKGLRAAHILKVTEEVYAKEDAMTDPSKRYWITEQGMKEAAVEIRSRSFSTRQVIEIIAKHAHCHELGKPCNPNCSVCKMGPWQG